MQCPHFPFYPYFHHIHPLSQHLSGGGQIYPIITISTHVHIFPYFPGYRPYSRYSTHFPNIPNFHPNAHNYQILVAQPIFCTFGHFTSKFPIVRWITHFWPYNTLILAFLALFCEFGADKPFTLLFLVLTPIWHFSLESTLTHCFGVGWPIFRTAPTPQWVSGIYRGRMREEYIIILKRGHFLADGVEFGWWGRKKHFSLQAGRCRQIYEILGRKIDKYPNLHFWWLICRKAVMQRQQR